MTCYHCSGSALCDCVSCNKDGKPSACQPCKARKFYAMHGAYLARFDPRQSKNWRRVPAHDGTPASREYLPLKGLE